MRTIQTGGSTWSLARSLHPFYAERAWVSGVQGEGNLGIYTEDFCICWPDSPPQNQSRTYTLTPCATPTPNTYGYANFNPAAYSYTQRQSNTQGSPNSHPRP